MESTYYHPSQYLKYQLVTTILQDNQLYYVFCIIWHANKSSHFNYASMNKFSDVPARFQFVPDTEKC